MLAWMSRVSLELIGQAGIGVSFDALAETTPPSEYMRASNRLMYILAFFTLFVTSLQETNDRIRPLWLQLQGFMRFIPSIVDMGPPTLRGFLAKIAPHRDIRKLRKIVYLLYDTNKSLYQQRVDAVTQAEKNGTGQGPGRDIVSVLSECGPSFKLWHLTHQS
jgi:hypothetical protein